MNFVLRISGVVCLLAVLHGCNRNPTGEVVSLAGPTMGTRYRILLAVAHDQRFDRVDMESRIATTLTTLDKELSTYRPDSELSAFNASSSTEWFAVSVDLLKVVDASLDIGRQTSGAFDITVGPLVDLWGFGPHSTHQAVPDLAQIARTLQRVGYNKLHTRDNPPALRKDIPDLQIDVNAIAPGYAIDLLASLVESQGFKNYLIDLGGESYARGEKPNGEPWRVGIEDPSPAARTVRQVVALDGEAISTAGDYREYFESNGKHYSHIIDPKTGSPVIHNVASVTVIASTAMSANGWDTALMAMGPGGLELARQNHIPAAFIFRNDNGFSLERTAEFYSFAAPSNASP